jgi:hypothetical protein
VACLVMTRSVPTRRAVAVPVSPLWAQDEPEAAKEAGCGPAAAARAITPGRRLPVWPEIVGQLLAGRRCPETMRRLSDGRCRNGERQRRRRRCVTSFARNNIANDDRRKFRCLGPGERVWGLIDSGVSESWQQGSCAPPKAPGQPPYLPGEKRRRTGSAALHPSGPPHRVYGLNPIPAGSSGLKPDGDCGYLCKRRKFRLWPQLSTSRWSCGYVVRLVGQPQLVTWRRPGESSGSAGERGECLDCVD